MGDWREFYDDKKGTWRAVRLLLSTDTALSPETLIESGGLRWSIESMFHQVKQAWQQTRQTLHRWAHLTMIGYGLVQMLTLFDNDDINRLCNHPPWRAVETKTAGHIRKGLTIVFRQVGIRALWNKRCQNFAGVKMVYDDDSPKYCSKAA